MFLSLLLFAIILISLFYFSFYLVTKIIQKKDNPVINKEPPPAPDVRKTPRFFKSFNTRKNSDTPKTHTSRAIEYCPYCDSKIPKGAWKCWHCKSILPVSTSNKIASVILALVCVFLLFFSISSLNFEQSSRAPTMSKSEYINKCRTISYEKLARNPDSYKGEYFKFTGEVIQVIEHNNRVDLRVNVTSETVFETTYYSDTIFVVTTLSDDGDRILEGDIITLYGVCDGLYTYTTVLGSTMSIPKIDSAYWDI